MLDHSCQVQRHTHAERGEDLYETPGVAVKALLRHYQPKQPIWEPAAGRGAIVRELRGFQVVASDKIDYGSGARVADFFTVQPAFVWSGTILTNPPFKYADKFVAKALQHCEHVVMLLRLAFMESERRSNILDTGRLRRVLVFRRRLPMMHRDGWEGRKANSGMTFAWFIWDGAQGPTTIERVSWDR